MRLIFAGTPEFAVPHLEALVEAGHDVALVVSRPDKPVGRGKRMTSPPVVVRARELGLDVAQPRAIKRGPFPERFAAVEADVAVVVAYGRILTEHYLEGPRYGCVNVHGSLLPRWRGAAPIQAAVLAGDTLSGVCTQRMTLGLDEGDVYLAESVPLDERETAGSLYGRLMELGPRVLLETLADIENRVPVPQHPDEATYCGLIEKSDGELDLSQSAVDVDRRIRAMTPWPGGFVSGEAGNLKVLLAEPVPGDGEAGTLLSVDPLVVACGEGALRLDEVQVPGRRRVDGASYANGQRLNVGDPLWT